MSAAAGEAEQKLLAEAFDGCDAVLSALGATVQPVPHRPDDGRCASNRDSHAISQGVPVHPADSAVHRLSSRAPEAGRMADQAASNRPKHGRLWRAECHLTEQCSDINFTVVKPPGLTNEPLDEQRELKAAEGQFVPEAADRRMSRAKRGQVHAGLCRV
uniref:NAD(P)-binding domain-containing protein n=1 Tax=Macrostomum lignano TaxID=282301 RepID=A0A1I8FQI5_9PLAT